MAYLKSKQKYLNYFLILSGLLPFLAGRITTLLIFSVFVLVWLCSPYLIRLPKFGLPLFVRYVGVGLLFCVLTEYFVFKENFELFNSNAAYDIFLSLGIYMSLNLIWYFLLKKYPFSLKEIFATAGVWGIVFEQNFKILLSFNPLAYLFIFVVYGSLVSIPFLFYGLEFQIYIRLENKKKYLKAFAAQCLGYIAGFIWIAVFRTILHLK